MLRRHTVRPRITMFLLYSLLVACGQLRPPESCGAGGMADKEKFNQYFVDMLLFDETLGGAPRIHTEAGPTFLPDSPVSIQAESLGSVEIRFCVEERKGGGEISFNELRTIPEGINTISLGDFEPSSYVVRVIHDNVLIRNLPFIVE